MVKNRDFCRAMLCISAASVVMRCLSVRPSVTFVDHVKTNKLIFEFFSPSSSHTILVFPHKTGWRYSDGTPPPNGGVVECRWGRQKRDSGLISGFAAYRSTVLSTVRVAKCEKQSRDEWRINVEHSPRRPSSVVHTRRRRSVCDRLDVIRRRRREVTPLVITPVFCCRRTS